MEEEDILRIIQSNPLAKGVTFSGGEPFAQPEGFTRLAKLLKERNYEVASYSGYTFEELYTGTEAQQKLLQNIDVLIDGRYVEAKRNLNLVYRGSSNQRIIDVRKSLEKVKQLRSNPDVGSENIKKKEDIRGDIFFLLISYNSTIVASCPVYLRNFSMISDVLIFKLEVLIHG